MPALYRTNWPLNQERWWFAYSDIGDVTMHENELINSKLHVTKMNWDKLKFFLGYWSYLRKNAANCLPSSPAWIAVSKQLKEFFNTCSRSSTALWAPMLRSSRWCSLHGFSSLQETHSDASFSRIWNRTRHKKNQKQKREALCTSYWPQLFDWHL